MFIKMNWRSSWRIPYDYVPRTKINPKEKYPVITNVVAIGTAGASVNQIDLTRGLDPIVRFGPTFAAAILRAKNNTGLIFDNGNVVVTGCKSPWQSLLAMHELLWMISQVNSMILIEYYDKDTGKSEFNLEERLLGCVCKFKGYRVVNIVASGHLLDEGCNVDLSKMAREDPTTRYNPDAFSGLWKPLRQGKVNMQPTKRKRGEKKPKNPVCHIFDPSTYVMMGFKCMKEVKVAFRYLREEVKKYPDPNAPIHPSGKYAYRVSKFNLTGSRKNVYLK